VGETRIDNVHHIDRGYDDLVGRLAQLGADVTRVES
jgi:UDP-N-acetylglucosamine 1-carboxyvinyltransferase